MVSIIEKKMILATYSKAYCESCQSSNIKRLGKIVRLFAVPFGDTTLGIALIEVRGSTFCREAKIELVHNCTTSTFLIKRKIWMVAILSL